MKRVIVAISKLNLANALQIRVLKSVCLRVVMIGNSTKWITAAREATRKYQLLGGDLDKEAKVQKFALPHAHAWNALLTVYKGTSPQAKDAVEKYVDVAKKNGGLTYFMNRVKTLRLTKAFDKEKCKVEISVIDGSPEEGLWESIVQEMRKDGAKVMPGMAPPGALERTIQDYLDSETAAAGRQGP